MPSSLSSIQGENITLIKPSHERNCTGTVSCPKGYCLVQEQLTPLLFHHRAQAGSKYMPGTSAAELDAATWGQLFTQPFCHYTWHNSRSWDLGNFSQLMYWYWCTGWHLAAIVYSASHRGLKFTDTEVFTKEKNTFSPAGERTVPCNSVKQLLYTKKSLILS